MSNKIEDLCCPNCRENIGKIDYRTGTYVPQKKPFMVEHGKVKLKCAKCDQFVNPQGMRNQYNPLNLPKT